VSRYFSILEGECSLFFEKKFGGMETIAAEPVAGIVRREREDAKKWGRE